MRASADLSPVGYATHRWTRVRNVDYCYLEAGDGPRVALLLHGFPDNAYSWEAQIRFLSARGYRVVAPFLRGYPPTSCDDGAFFDRATVAADIDALLERTAGGRLAYLVGQDWGAAIGYGLLGAFPERVVRAMLLAVPHPVEIRRTLRRSPRQVIRSFHWFFFQAPLIPELVIRGTRGAFLRQLWRHWSPNLQDDAHVEQAVQSMLAGRCIEDTLAYYRAALQPRFRDPALADVFARLDDPIHVPTKVLCGEQDERRKMLSGQRDLFEPQSTYEWELVPSSGHFVHREQPDIVNERIVDWFERNAAVR